MAVLGRLLVSSAERLDLPDLLSIDSYTAGDFKYLVQTFVGSDTPYIITGFDVIDPAAAIGTSNIAVNIANSAMYYPGSGAGSFYYGLPTGDPNAQPLVPVLISNSTNYVYLTMTTFNTAQDTRAFWDPDANGQVGDEFTEEVNTESVIQVQVNISTSAFPENTVPVAIVVMGPTVISSITDARPLMFRLGSGGQAPNPYNRFAWPALPNSTYERTETPITITSGSGPNPFESADKDIFTLKEWMDAVMSKLAELGGTTFWYQAVGGSGGGGPSLVSLFEDAIETSIITKGHFTHSSMTPGLLTWSEDINYEITGDERDYVLRAGFVNIPNDYVAYIALNRNQPFNGANAAVSWVNGANYVNTPNGSIGFFANLSQADWVKRPVDPDNYYLQVVAFYDSTNGGGAITTPANAKSIVLNGTYQGPTINDIGTFDQGIYSTSDSPADVIVSARNNPAISAVGGNFSWIAFREDTILDISNVTTHSLTITNITTTENTALVTTSAAHGLSNGYYITISGTTNYNGTFVVEVESSNTFSVTVASSFPTESSGTARWAAITTAATYIPGSNPPIQLESADHGFANGETIIIAGTGTALDGNSYQVGVIDATHFQLGAPAAITSSTGSATLAKVFVRNQNGTMQVIQGVSVDPDGPYDNIKLFIGMAADSQIHPEYATTISNVLEGEENFNTLATENVTNRLSNLTAMMADRAQDKTIKYLPADIVLVNNTTAGSAQQITFTSLTTPTLTILQPGSPGNAVITLPTSPVGISLLVGQSAYVSINRNLGTTPTWTVANNSAIPVDENIFVIATRLSETNIYLWDGSEWPVGGTPFAGTGTGIYKVNLYDPLDSTLPTGTGITIDSVTVTAGMQVLFSNLGSGNNEVYIAVGTGTTITSWSAQFAFAGNVAPSTADLIIVSQGQLYANQIGEFNGTTWQFNNVVRYFGSGNDRTNYWEQSGLLSSTLTNNVTNSTLFSVVAAGSQNMIIDYSIIRGVSPEFKETGSLYVTTDGTTVSVATGGANLNGSSGVTFNGVISGSNIVVQYSTTNTGSSATIKYSIKRWSDTSGGPSGPPSYSAAAASGVTSLNGESGAVTLVAGTNITITPAGNNITIASTGGSSPGGPTNSIQYNNSGTLGGVAEFSVDTVNNVLNLNGLSQSVLNGPFTITDGQVSPATIFSFNSATYTSMVVEYSIVKSGAFRTGRLLIATDASSVATLSDDFVETSPSGVVLSVNYNAGSIEIQYVSSVTGFNGNFKYSFRSWS